MITVDEWHEALVRYELRTALARIKRSSARNRQAEGELDRVEDGMRLTALDAWIVEEQAGDERATMRHPVRDQHDDIVPLAGDVVALLHLGCGEESGTQGVVAFGGFLP